MSPTKLKLYFISIYYSRLSIISLIISINQRQSCKNIIKYLHVKYYKIFIWLKN